MKQLSVREIVRFEQLGRMPVASGVVTLQFYVQ